MRNRITLPAAILDFSEAAVHSHLFLKIYSENTGGRVLPLVKLETGCSEWRSYNKTTPPSSKAPVHSHPFSKFLQEIPVVQSFFCSNYRLTVQRSDYILKCLHQECFLENLPLGLFRSSYPQPPILKNVSRKYR